MLVGYRVSGLQGCRVAGLQLGVGAAFICGGEASVGILFQECPMFTQSALKALS